MGLCGQFLQPEGSMSAGYDLPHVDEFIRGLTPVDEDPETQMSNIYGMMWPDLPAPEADAFMREDAWMGWE